MSTPSHRINATNVAQTRGLLAGAAIFAAFGSLWAVMALIHWNARPEWSLPAAVAIVVGLIGACALRLLATRHIVSADNPAAAAAGKRAGMLFGIIFTIEAGLIAVCAIVLARYGQPQWIPIAAALVVSVHFLPLAHVFRVPLYYGTGVLMLLGVSGCLMIPDMALRLLCVGLAMTAVLWASACVLLWQTRLGSRRSGRDD